MPAETYDYRRYGIDLICDADGCPERLQDEDWDDVPWQSDIERLADESGWQLLPDGKTVYCPEHADYEEEDEIDSAE